MLDGFARGLWGERVPRGWGTERVHLLAVGAHEEVVGVHPLDELAQHAGGGCAQLGIFAGGGPCGVAVDRGDETHAGLEEPLSE